MKFIYKTSIFSRTRVSENVDYDSLTRNLPLHYRSFYFLENGMKTGISAKRSFLTKEFTVYKDDLRNGEYYLYSRDRIKVIGHYKNNEMCNSWMYFRRKMRNEYLVDSISYFPSFLNRLLIYDSLDHSVILDFTLATVKDSFGIIRIHVANNYYAYDAGNIYNLDDFRLMINENYEQMSSDLQEYSWIRSKYKEIVEKHLLDNIHKIKYESKYWRLINSQLSRIK